MKNVKVSNRRMISRRSFLRAGALAGLGASAGGSLLASCAPAGGGGGEAKELRALVMNLPWGEAVRDEIAQAYEGESGVSIVGDVAPYDTLQEKVFLELGAGSSSYDIVATDCIWVGACINSNWVLSVEDMKKENSDLPDINWDTPIPASLPYIADLDGKRYGIPSSLTTPTLAYRKDLFEQWGFEAPKTWDDYYTLLDEIQKAAEADGLEDFYPTSLIQASQDPGYSDWTFHLFGFGPVADKGDGYILSADGEPIFNIDDRGVKALDDLHRVLPYSPPGTLGFDYGEGSNLFNSGQSAMLLTWNDFYADTENPEFSTVAGQVGYSAIPAHNMQVNPVGGFQLFINAASENPEEAYKFLAWIMEGPAFDMILEKGETGIQVEKDLEDPDVLERLPYLDAWNAIENTAYIPVWFEQFTEVQRVIWEEVASSLAGEKSSEEAMQLAEDRVSELMGV